MSLPDRKKESLGLKTPLTAQAGSDSEYIPGQKPKLKHLFAECSCDHPNCLTCLGEESFCQVCKGYNETLTTTCPGFVLNALLQSIIKRGQLDYCNGFWTDPRSSSKWTSPSPPEPVRTLIGTFEGSELYADTSEDLGSWKITRVPFKPSIKHSGETGTGACHV